MSLIRDIREDPEYKKYKKIVLLVREKLKIEKDKAEALSLHAGRTLRKLHGSKQYSPKALVDAAANEAAARSRLVEMRVQCAIQTDLLHSTVKALRQHVMTSYREELSDFRTVADRAAMLDRVAAGALTTESESQALIKLLDDLVNDIDKSSFHLRAMVDVLKLLDGSKSGTVV